MADLTISFYIFEVLPL